IELFWEPPVYGRHEAGTSSTIARYQPKLTTIAAKATTRSTIFLRHEAGAAMAYAMTSDGSSTNAWSILARKPMPMATPASASHFRDAASVARTVKYPAAT